MVTIDERVAVQFLVYKQRVRASQNLLTHVASMFLLWPGDGGVVRSAVLSHAVVVAWSEVTAIDAALLSLVDMALDVLAPVRLLG